MVPDLALAGSVREFPNMRHAGSIFSIFPPQISVIPEDYIPSKSLSCRKELHYVRRGPRNSTSQHTDLERIQRCRRAGYGGSVSDALEGVGVCNTVFAYRFKVLRQGMGWSSFAD